MDKLEELKLFLQEKDTNYPQTHFWLNQLLLSLIVDEFWWCWEDEYFEWLREFLAIKEKHWEDFDLFFKL